MRTREREPRNKKRRLEIDDIQEDDVQDIASMMNLVKEPPNLENQDAYLSAWMATFEARQNELKDEASPENIFNLYPGLKTDLGIKMVSSCYFGSFSLGEHKNFFLQTIINPLTSRSFFKAWDCSGLKIFYALGSIRAGLSLIVNPPHSATS